MNKWPKIKSSIYQEKLDEVCKVFVDVKDNSASTKTPRCEWTVPLKNWTTAQIKTDNSLKLSLQEFAHLSGQVNALKIAMANNHGKENEVIQEYQQAFTNDYLRILESKTNELKLEVTAELVEEKQFPLELFVIWYEEAHKLPPEQFNEELGDFWGDVWKNAGKGAGYGGLIGGAAGGIPTGGMGTFAGAGLGGLAGWAAGGLYGGASHLLKKVWHYRQTQRNFEQTKQKALEALKNLKDLSDNFDMHPNFIKSLDTMIDQLGTARAYRTAGATPQPTDQNAIPGKQVNTTEPPTSPEPEASLGTSGVPKTTPPPTPASSSAAAASPPVSPTAPPGATAAAPLAPKPTAPPGATAAAPLAPKPTAPAPVVSAPVTPTAPEPVVPPVVSAPVKQKKEVNIAKGIMLQGRLAFSNGRKLEDNPWLRPEKLDKPKADTWAYGYNAAKEKAEKGTPGIPPEATPPVETSPETTTAPARKRFDEEKHILDHYKDASEEELAKLGTIALNTIGIVQGDNDKPQLNKIQDMDFNTFTDAFHQLRGPQHVPTNEDDLKDMANIGRQFLQQLTDKTSGGAGTSKVDTGAGAPVPKEEKPLSKEEVLETLRKKFDYLSHLASPDLKAFIAKHGLDDLAKDDNDKITVSGPGTPNRKGFVRDLAVKLNRSLGGPEEPPSPELAELNPAAPVAPPAAAAAKATEPGEATPPKPKEPEVTATPPAASTVSRPQPKKEAPTGEPVRDYKKHTDEELEKLSNKELKKIGMHLDLDTDIKDARNRRDIINILGQFYSMPDASEGDRTRTAKAKAEKWAAENLLKGKQESAMEKYGRILHERKLAALPMNEKVGYLKSLLSCRGS